MRRAPPPRIEIGSPGSDRQAGEDLEAWALLIADWFRSAPRAAVARCICALIEEGARFARTPEGERWQSILLESRWGHTGWLMWNMLEMDQLVVAPPPRPDPFAAVVENVAAAVRAGTALPRRDGPQDLPGAPLPPSDGAYGERNSFLFVALGLLAVSERGMASLGGAGPPIAPAAPAGPRPPAVTALLR